MSLAKTAPGSEEYYIQYAADGAEEPGEWMGEGAKELGLSGKVEPEILRNLFRGLRPDGTSHLINLSAIRKDLSHVPAWDFTLSAPKDVSLVGGLFDDFKVKVDRCQREAVKAAVQYIESTCIFTRRGSGGKHLERAKPIIACFNHLTSRNNDPLWHSHLLILNAGAHSDGFGTIVSKALYDHQTAINTVYLAGLAKALQRELAVTIEAKELKAFEPGDTFKIVGIPENLRELMSSRRAEILSARAKFGANDGHGTEIAALATRKLKTHVPISILKTHWKKAAEAIGVDLRQLKTSLRAGVSETEATTKLHSAENVEDEKPEHAQKAKGNVRASAPKQESREENIFSGTSRNSQKPQPDSARPVSPKIAASIIEAAARSAIAAKMPDKMVDRLIDQALYEFDRKHRLDKVSNPALKKAAAEKSLTKILAICDKMAIDVRHAVEAKGIKHGLLGKITSRDADGALVQTMSKTGAIACVETKGGVDANLFIEALAREYKKAGLNVRAFTATPVGASELETAAGIKVHTVGQLLYRLKTSIVSAGLHHALQIVRAAMDLPIAERWRFNSKTVVIVTQAQGLKAIDLERILAEAKSTEAKVVLFGASDQILRREPQNAFSKISDHVGKVSLSDPVIQKKEWMKDAVFQVAHGDARGAFSQYALADRLHLAKDQRTATAELVDYWRKLPKDERSGKTLIIAGSARDTRVLNRLAQRKTGLLGVFVRQRVDGTWVHKGDRILFRISSKHYGFKAGDLGTIEKIGLNGMQIRLDRTRWALLRRPSIRVDVPKNLYRGLTLGYAVSATDAQGMTCDNALILPTAGGEDLRGLLVQLSRAQENARIFTSTRSVGEDIDALSNCLRKERERESVVMTADKKSSRDERLREEESVRESRIKEESQQKQGLHV